MKAPPNLEKAWTLFVTNVAERLEAGRREYGDRSFSREPKDLLREIEEELYDVAGWGFVLWSRLQTVKIALEGLPATNSSHEE